MDADRIRAWVYAGQGDKTCDSSARRAVFDHLADIVDNVDYDIKCGNYSEEKAAKVLEQQIRGELEELAIAAGNIIKEFDDA